MANLDEMYLAVNLFRLKREVKQWHLWCSIAESPETAKAAPGRRGMPGAGDVETSQVPFERR